MSKENKFYEISEETVNIFMEIASQKCFNEISFQFIGCDTQKTLIKISKLSEQYEFLLNKHILVSLNELLLHKFEEESIHILFEQELDKIHFNIETAKVKLIKTDINTFSTLIKKYGIEKISKANQLAEITAEKMVSNDFENDFIS
jgi:tRNA(Ile2) C34 agmatinyltransferase TiaS